jgi:hypothetical protein
MHDRKSETYKRSWPISGYVGKRKSHQEAHPEVVALARSLARRRKRPLSLREISAELAAAGHLNHNGKPYAAASNHSCHLL